MYFSRGHITFMYILCTLFITFRKQDSVLIAYKKCKFCKTRFFIFYFIILFLSEVAGLGLQLHWRKNKEKHDNFNVSF